MTKKQIFATVAIMLSVNSFMHGNWDGGLGWMATATLWITICLEEEKWKR